MDRTESCLPDDDGRGDDDEPVAGIYRTRVRNVLLAVVLAGSAVLGCSDFSGSSSEDFTSSRRLAITAVIASVLIIRTLRRAVIVSPTGIEARRTLWTWRVPWSVVESFAIGEKPDPSRRRGPMTVVLIDGSSRCARVGWGRRGQPTFPEVADAARRHQRLHQRGYLEPNGPLLAFLLGGIALVTACAVSETGRMNQRLFRAGSVSYTADELRELGYEIAIAEAIAWILGVALVGTAIAALVWSRRPRGVAPVGPWPGSLQFPDDDLGRASSPPTGVHAATASWPPPHAVPGQAPLLDIPSLIVCQPDGVFRTDGALLAAISSRRVTWTDVTVYTFWRARGEAACSVQIQAPPGAAAVDALSPGARWALTSWASPLPAVLEVATDDASSLILSGDGTADVRLMPVRSALRGCRYTAVDEHRRSVATLERSRRGWECRIGEELPPMTRLLLCVAPLWAERRYHHLNPSD